MFWHNFKNRLKITLKKKTIIFWTLLFPIALGTFFYLAFSNLAEDEKFDVISIAVVNNDKFKMNTEFKSVIDSLSNEDDNKIFNTFYVNVEEAQELLNTNEIVGYLEVNDSIDIFVKNSGINETILKYVVDNFYQMMSTVNTLINYNPEILSNGILNILQEDTNYLTNTTGNKIDNTVVYFYTLIGMVCLYAGFFGISAVNDTESNLSTKGARVSIAPVSKTTMLLSSLLAGFIIQYLEIIILLLYLIFILGVDFGNQILPILLLTFCGTLTGISLGALVGVVSKKNENIKTGILTAVTMALSFMAGMMVQNIKQVIANNIPILASINPVNLITDALYALYYYDGYERYFQNIIGLLIITFVFIVIAIILMRRKKYDSI